MGILPLVRQYGAFVKVIGVMRLLVIPKGGRNGRLAQMNGSEDTIWTRRLFKPLKSRETPNVRIHPSPPYCFLIPLHFSNLGKAGLRLSPNGFLLGRLCRPSREINVLHCIQIYRLSRLPKVMIVLHGQPTLRGASKCL